MAVAGRQKSRLAEHTHEEQSRGKPNHAASAQFPGTSCQNLAPLLHRLALKAPIATKPWPQPRMPVEMSLSAPITARTSHSPIPIHSLLASPRPHPSKMLCPCPYREQPCAKKTQDDSGSKMKQRRARRHAQSRTKKRTAAQIRIKMATARQRGAEHRRTAHRRPRTEDSPPKNTNELRCKPRASKARA
jgi:hypothetical protein